MDARNESKHGPVRFSADNRDGDRRPGVFRCRDIDDSGNFFPRAGFERTNRKWRHSPAPCNH
jgi:hypothetical protein